MTGLLSIEPIEGADFGRIVRGLTADHLDDDSVPAALRQLWVEHGLLVFPAAPEEPGFQIKLGSCFGELERQGAVSMQVDGHPELVWLTSDLEYQAVFRVDDEDVVGWFPWHSDTIWRSEVIRGGLLRAHTLPEKGGDTGFMCRRAAYDRLPVALKRRIEGLEVVYKLTDNIADHPYTRCDGVVRISNPPANEEVGKLMEAMAPPVAHPLAATQPETGRKYLNFSPMHARHVVGFTEEEAGELLTEVARYLCDDNLAYRHRWQIGDLLLWDNWRINHRAYGTPVGEVRAMQRATILGAGVQGRILDDAAIGRDGAGAAVARRVSKASRRQS